MAISIELVYGDAERQVLERVQVPDGTAAREALRYSVQLAAAFPDVDWAAAPLGIFGKAVKDNERLRAGDRLEIYRPLLIDPKEARRLRARQKETK